MTFDTVPTRFAILSFAHYHANFWAEAIGQMPGEAVLAGIWDDDPSRGQEAAARFGTTYEPDLEMLLANSDAAGIVSETAKHRELIEACAEAGVHVFCEKPLATTLEDAIAVRAIENAGGIVIRQNFPKRTDPINEELLNLIRSEVLGTPALVRIRHGHRHGLDSGFRAQWYADPVQSGGGTLIDEGVHAADLLRWFFGDPDEVSAAVTTHLPGLDVEDTASAVYLWPSGLLAEVTMSWTFVAAEQSIEVFGPAGTAVLDGVDIASRTIATQPYLRWYLLDGDEVVTRSSTLVPRFAAGDFHHEGPKRFIRFLRGGPDGLATVEDGIEALEMVLAAYRSAASGRTEPVGGRDGS